MRVLIVLLSVVSLSIALQCYDYSSNNNDKVNQKSWVECPFDTQFCFKNYQEQTDFTGRLSSVERRSCGTQDLCQREGCRGDNRNKDCCCRKGFCNGVSATGIISSLIAAASVLLLKM